MTDSEMTFWALVVAAISGFFGIAAVIVAVRALRVSRDQLKLQERTVVAQNVFDVPVLACSLFRDNCPATIILGVKINKGRMAEVSLPLVIANEGSKTAQDVTVYLRVPKNLTFGNRVEMNELTDSWAKMKDMKTAFVPEDNFGTYAFSVPRLSTHERIILMLPLAILGATEIVDTVKVTTKDNREAALTYKARFAYSITIFAASEASKPVSRQYNFEVLDISNESLTEIINERSVVGLKNRGKVSRLQNLLEVLEYIRLGKSKDWFPRVFACEFSDEDKISDPNRPVDSYSLKHARWGVGHYSERLKTYSIPALGTTEFGY